MLRQTPTNYIEPAAAYPKGRRVRASKAQSGFTLIELLVVIVITLILITLLFGPLITGFRLTSAAQATTQAQDSARIAMEQLAREIGSAAAVRDTSHQYLDMEMYTRATIAGGSEPDETIAHAYDAYIDLIPPHAATSTSTSSVADPTVDTGSANYHAVQSSNGSYVLVDSGLGLPIAPGTTIVRWFIGLRHPFQYGYTPAETATTTEDQADAVAQEQPYASIEEGQIFRRGAAAGPSGKPWSTSETTLRNLDNPYVLYRAEVSPYVTTTTVVAGITTRTNKVNSKFFADDGTGNPVLDDPDFFRVNGYINHDSRLYYWYQQAKPVIDLPNINLIFLPHNANGNVTYNDDAIGWPTGTATDSNFPTANPVIPLLRTSVTFAPATVSSDPLAATASSDVSQGEGADPSDTLSPYVPSEYRAQYGEWHGDPSVLISTTGLGTLTNYTTYSMNPAGTPGQAIVPGDLIETIPGAPSDDVYDISTNTVLDPTKAFVPMTIDGANGVISFGLPDLPLSGMAAKTQTGYNVTTPAVITYVPTAADVAAGVVAAGSADTTNKANPYWYITFGPGYGIGSDGGSGETSAPPLQIHLKPQPQIAGYVQTNDAVLLPNPTVTLTGTPVNQIPNITIPNGRVVINSERVYGPEQRPGAGSYVPTTQVIRAGQQPASYPLVPYRRIQFNPGSVDSLDYDEYMIDYDHGIIYLGSNTGTGSGIDINQESIDVARTTVLVAYDYQANDTILPNVNATPPPASGPPSEITSEAPDTVRASYQTGSRLQVSVGIRLYDVTSGHPTYFSLTNAIDVGNAIK